MYAKQESLVNLKGTMDVEPPNNQLYKCDLTFSHNNGQKVDKIQMNIENVCLRGMILSATDSVTGVVLYTGHETRI